MCPQGSLDITRKVHHGDREPSCGQLPSRAVVQCSDTMCGVRDWWIGGKGQGLGRDQMQRQESLQEVSGKKKTTQRGSIMSSLPLPTAPPSSRSNQCLVYAQIWSLVMGSCAQVPCLSLLLPSFFWPHILPIPNSKLPVP